METNEDPECPVCYRKFSVVDIEVHVNKCLFLNSTEESQSSKRRRTSSPSLLNSDQNVLFNEKKKRDTKSVIEIGEKSESIEIISDDSCSSFEIKLDDEILEENNPSQFISTRNVPSGSNSSGNLSELVKQLNAIDTTPEKQPEKEIHPFFTNTFHSNKTINKVNQSPIKSKQSPSKVQPKSKPSNKRAVKALNDTIQDVATKTSNRNIPESTQKMQTKNVQKTINNPDQNVQTISAGGSNKNVQLSKETVEKKMSFIVPLAKQLQPKSLDDFIGQNHVFGENSVLRTLLAKGEVPNMILWGPPGSGKTSLAGVVQDICKKESKRLRFVSLCAANAGVKDVQTVVTAAKNELKFGRQTILFMDEIHRFNKKQQDTFLIHVEKGEIILIGATTENPSFSINNALLSRCRVIVFEKLDTDALLKILINATNNLGLDLIEDDDPMKYDCNKRITRLSIEKSALTWLADTSDGDARIALNNLQLVLQHNTNKICVIAVEDIQDEIKKSHLLYDRKGEEHYNLISALHKSIRASDDNASLYWCTRMIVSGEDPLYIARRLVRAASEDIGNSDPNALQLAVSTMQGCQLLGMPECDVLLAQCAIYLARAPKSQEADRALSEAKHYIKNFEGPQPNVPMHLRNAPTQLMQDLGYGQLKDGSEYHCMPEGCEDTTFF